MNGHSMAICVASTYSEHDLHVTYKQSWHVMQDLVAAICPQYSVIGTQCNTSAPGLCWC